MYYLLSLLLFSLPSNALLLGSINYHYDTRANNLYSGRLNDGIHLAPMIGIESKKNVTLVGVNSIHKPIVGYYRKLNYGIVLGSYIQDTSEFKKKNIDFAIKSDIIPIVGLDLSFMWGGVIFTPTNASLYWRL